MVVVVFVADQEKKLPSNHEDACSVTAMRAARLSDYTAFLFMCQEHQKVLKAAYVIKDFNGPYLARRLPPSARPDASSNLPCV